MERGRREGGREGGRVRGGRDGESEEEGKKGGGRTKTRHTLYSKGSYILCRVKYGCRIQDNIQCL